MPELKDEIAAYEKMRSELEANHVSKWVIVHNCELVGIYDSLESAAEEAVKKFGRGPYLIRQVGSSSLVLPASVMYVPVHGPNQVRL